LKRSILTSAVFGFGLLTSSAFGSNISVEATSKGCFFLQGAVCSPTTTAQVGGLTFTGSSISGSDSFSSILGSFSINNDPYVYDDTYFGLFITFTLPTAGLSADYTAALSGKINATGHGDVRITFDAPTSITQTFNTVNGPSDLTVALGNNTFNVNPAGHNPNSSIDAQISALPSTSSAATAVPEPGSWVLFATGLAMVGLSRLRKRRQTA
jgi:hypothetical protein